MTGISNRFCLALLSAVTVAIPSAVAQPCLEWINRSLPPYTRDKHDMVYDSHRGVVVLFGGGYFNGGQFGDTWEWDGLAWTLRHPGDPDGITAPRPRHNLAMAYDSIRRVTVLFGGREVGNVLPVDTWEWDGATWELRATSGPPGRQGHAMAFHTDGQTGVTLLYGGVSRSDTWEWNGTQWTQRNVSGPGVRSTHGMACDPIRGRTVLFGKAWYESQPVNDTREWDGSAWTLVHPGGSSAPGVGLPLAFDSVRGKIALFGGGNETWEWDGNARTWTRLSPGGGTVCSDIPAPRNGHAMTFDSARGVLVVFGGGNMQGAGTWEGSGGVWTERTTDRAISLQVYPDTIAFDVARGEVMHYTEGVTSTWDGSHWTRRFCEGPQSHFATMAYDSARERVILHGDQQTWEWDGTHWTQVSSGGPPVLGNNVMAYDPTHGAMLVYGGTETWAWEAGQWELAASGGTPPLDRHALVFHGDASGGEIMMFGGGDGANSRNETWTWDWTSRTWTLRTVSGPPARHEHAMAYDPERRVTVLWGGRFAPGQGRYDDTWEWTGSEWRPTTLVGPAPHFSPTMAYDARRHRMVMVTSAVSAGGGFDYETWELGCRCPGDLNDDSAVGLGDLTILLSHFGGVGGPSDGDLDSDGDVDLSDLTLLLANFGATCP